jgi:hypothetical protein
LNVIIEKGIVMIGVTVTTTVRNMPTGTGVIKTSMAITNPPTMIAGTTVIVADTMAIVSIMVINTTGNIVRIIGTDGTGHIMIGITTNVITIMTTIDMIVTTTQACA